MKNLYFLIASNYLLHISFCFGQAGTIDSTFGTNGATTSFYHAEHLIVQPNDKILIVGGTVNNFGLCRFNSDGKVDNSFGKNGRANGATDPDAAVGCSGIALQDDGRIIVSSSSQVNWGQFVIARYTSNGELDESFGTNGFSKTDLWGDYSSQQLVVQSDGKIIAGGDLKINNIKSGFGLVRYNQNGNLDNSFGTGGKVITGFSMIWTDFMSLTIQPDGKILAIGNLFDSTSSYKVCAVARYNSDGSLDNSFGSLGKLELFSNAGLHQSQITSVISQSDYKILIGGYYWSIPDADTHAMIIRLNPDGSLDNSFGTEGMVREDFDKIHASGNEFNDIFLQSDNKIVGVGYSHYNSSDPYYFTMARFNSNGTLDSTFANNGMFLDSLFSNQATDIAIQSTNKILVTNEYVVYRFLSGFDLETLDLSKDSYLIYPNPVHLQAILKYILAQDEKLNIELFDVQGKLMQIFMTDEIRPQGNHTEVLHFDQSLTSGTYILNIGNGKNKQVMKIIIE